MTRTRTSRSRPEDLAESWDDVGDSYEDDSLIYDDEEERDEVGDEYRPRMNGRSRPSRANDSTELPRRRVTRSSAEPELVMPASPNAAARLKAESKQRASTPHMRMNQRSLTSDAGEIRRTTRSSTPRQRLGDRSMTGDAGRYRRASKLQAHDEAEYESDEASSKASLIWESAAKPLLTYALDIVGLTLRNLKPLVAYGLVAYIVAATLVFGYGFLHNTINNALSPICRLPFTSHLAFCPAPAAKGNAEFDRLVQAQDAFQDVLAGSMTGADLPVEMKRTEGSIRDLRSVVEYSGIPSKNELLFEFNGFIETARQASSDLSRFNSHIGRSVDFILSANRWTQTVIDDVKKKQAAQGTLSTWVENFNIFAPFQPAGVVSREVLLDQYLKHTDAVEFQIKTLIDEALTLRSVLDNLEGRLDVIADIVQRDDIKVGDDKDELLAALWTKLGGNRNSVAKLQAQLKLLKDVSLYRRLAWGHVTSTLLKLQAIQHNLEDLKSRVAKPELLGAGEVPLEVHLESINLGIERLESVREASRKEIMGKFEKVSQQGAAGTGRLEINGGKSEL